MRISDWSSDVCSTDLKVFLAIFKAGVHRTHQHAVLELGETEIQRLQQMRVSRAGQGIPLAGNAKKKIGKLKSVARGVLGFQDAGAAVLRVRSEERRVVKEGVSTFRTRCSPNH